MSRVNVKQMVKDNMNSINSLKVATISPKLSMSTNIANGMLYQSDANFSHGNLKSLK